MDWQVGRRGAWKADRRDLNDISDVASPRRLLAAASINHRTGDLSLHST